MSMKDCDCSDVYVMGLHSTWQMASFSICMLYSESMMASPAMISPRFSCCSLVAVGLQNGR